VKFPAVAAVNGKLYLAGGQLPSGSPGTGVSVYDPATKQWSSVASMKVGRYQAAAVGLNGLLYVIGGSDGNAPLTTAEVYDPATNTWRTLTGMPAARWSLAAGAINGKLYAFGGENGDSTLATNQTYTP
jgi:N-acetylneuraminic acid mutarotase